jgi:hypothetical protein
VGGENRARRGGFDGSAGIIAALTVVTMGAAYVFGAGDKTCRQGFLTVIYYLYFLKPVVLAIPLLAFVLGGLTARFVRTRPSVIAVVLLVLVLVSCAVGEVTSTDLGHPCSPL